MNTYLVELTLTDRPIQAFESGPDRLTAMRQATACFESKAGIRRAVVRDAGGEVVFARTVGRQVVR